MKCKRYLIIFFLLFSYVFTIAQSSYKILASINNEIITDIDIKNEIQLMTILNKDKRFDQKLNLYNLAFQNLVEEKVKKYEIDIEEKNLEKIDLDNYIKLFYKNTNININEINQKYHKLIVEKIKIDVYWNAIIRKNYGWKVNINLNEIDEKINNQKDKIFLNNEKTLIKEKLILEEKNKKMKVYSNYHYNLKKKEVLIKIFK